MLAAFPLERGELGTQSTVRVIRELIREGRTNPFVRGTAEQVLIEREVPERDQYAEAQALFNFVQGRLRYTRDPIDVEQLTTAEGLLRDHDCGDCDEFVILLASLLESIGISTRLKIVRKARSGPWRHIYLEAFISGRWLPLEPTNKRESMGWEVPHGDSFVLPIDGDLEDDVGILPAVLGIVDTVGQIYAQKKAAKAAEKQNEAAEKIAKQQVEAAKLTAAAETEKTNTLKKLVVPAAIGLGVILLLRR